MNRLIQLFENVFILEKKQIIVKTVAILHVMHVLFVLQRHTNSIFDFVVDVNPEILLLVVCSISAFFLLWRGDLFYFFIYFLGDDGSFKLGDPFSSAEGGIYLFL